MKTGLLKKIPLEFHAVLIFVFSQILKEYLFLHNLSQVCIDTSSLWRTLLHLQAAGFICRVQYKKEETWNELVPVLLPRSNLRRDRCSQALFILKHRPRCISRTSKFFCHCPLVYVFFHVGIMLQHTKPCLLGNKRAIVFRHPFTCLTHLFNFDGCSFDKSSESKTGWFTQEAKGAGGQARLLHSHIYK